MGLQIRAKGLQEIKASLKALGDDLENLDFSSLKSKALSLVQRVVPKRTGKFAASHQVEVTPNRIAVTTDDPARLLNYGIPRRNIAARHFYQKVDPGLENQALPVLDELIQQKIDQNGLH